MPTPASEWSGDIDLSVAFETEALGRVGVVGRAWDWMWVSVRAGFIRSVF